MKWIFSFNKTLFSTFFWKHSKTGSKKLKHQQHFPPPPSHPSPPSWSSSSSSSSSSFFEMCVCVCECYVCVLCVCFSEKLSSTFWVIQLLLCPIRIVHFRMKKHSNIVVIKTINLMKTLTNQNLLKKVIIGCY